MAVTDQRLDTVTLIALFRASSSAAATSSAEAASASTTALAASPAPSAGGLSRRLAASALGGEPSSIAAPAAASSLLLPEPAPAPPPSPEPPADPACAATAAVAALPRSAIDGKLDRGHVVQYRCTRRPPGRQQLVSAHHLHAGVVHVAAGAPRSRGALLLQNHHQRHAPVTHAAKHATATWWRSRGSPLLRIGTGIVRRRWSGDLVGRRRGWRRRSGVQRH